MRRFGVAFALSLTLGSAACAYHNVLFNAQTLYDDAEVRRRAGDLPGAEAYYRDVVRKAGLAVRDRPDSDWAPEALTLLGRAHFRLGDLRAAAAALEGVLTRSEDPVARAEARVYLAMISAEQGDRAGALAEVNRALEEPLGPGALAEAHLLRGRLMLQGSYSDQGWWDLDRASTVDSRVRVEAGLERLYWGIRHGDKPRSRRAVQGLYAYRAGGARADTIAALARSAGQRWNAAEAAALLDGVDAADWDREPRGRLALERARLLDEAGDTATAIAQAERVAAGLGVVAADARLLIARWRLEGADDLAEVYGVRGVLLPSGADPRVAGRLAAVDELESFASLGLDEPLGWFAAAEVARDRLGADYVARGLFLAYADGAPSEPWVPKALLAALEVSRDPSDRDWLRGRVEAHGDNPYVLAAHGGAAAGFEALEEELELRLSALTPR